MAGGRLQGLIATGNSHCAQEEQANLVTLYKVPVGSLKEARRRDGRLQRTIFTSRMTSSCRRTSSGPAAGGQGDDTTSPTRELLRRGTE